MDKRVLTISMMTLVGCVDMDEGDLGSVDQELAAENAIYQNGTYDDAVYDNGTFENGYAIGDAAWEQPWARVWTGPKANGFSIAYSRRWGSTFFTNQWVQNATQVQYVDNNATQCAHPSTRIGSALAAACNPLVQRVCASDAYCCATSWDQTCVNEAADTSNDFTGTHSTSVTGAALPDSHSTCAALVSSYRPSCRTQSWTSACVDDAFARCYARYVTRPRIEQSRLVADACVEPTTTGTAGCTNAQPGVAAGECCRRSLVLYGVFQDFPKDDTSHSGHGYKVQWSSRETETTPAGGTTVRATMVPEPCTGSYYFNGESFVRSCGREHHLWQLAGPGKSFYPDVPNAANTSTAEWNPVDAGHRNVRVRNVLVNVMTALINTSGDFTIDLRYVDFTSSIFGPLWLDSSDTGRLPPASGYANKTELVIDDVSGTDPLDATRHDVFGRVLCKGSDAPGSTRTETGAPTCATLDYSAASNRGKDSTIRSLWERL